MNRRNAVLGWVAWQAGKRIAKRKAKRKAKAAVPAIDTGSKRPNKPAIAAMLAAVYGALLFWRKRRDAGSEESGPSG